MYIDIGKKGINLVTNRILTVFGLMRAQLYLNRETVNKQITTTAAAAATAAAMKCRKESGERTEKERERERKSEGRVRGMIETERSINTI